MLSILSLLSAASLVYSNRLDLAIKISRFYSFCWAALFQSEFQQKIESLNHVSWVLTIVHKSPWFMLYPVIKLGQGVIRQGADSTE